MEITHKLLTSITSLSSGAIALAIKTLCLYDEGLVSIKVLKKHSDLSESLFYSYLEEIKEDVSTGKPTHNINTVPIDLSNLKESKKKFIKMGKQKANAKKKKSKRKIRAEKINQNILHPWYRYLRRHGYDKIITDSFRKFSFGMIQKVLKEYNFNHEEILNILNFGTENDFLKEKSVNTNIKTIFFSGANIPQKYIRKRGNLYKIRTHTGDTADPQDFGYFKKKNNEYIFIPPKIKGNLYNKINKEVKRRLQGKSKNNDFNHLFKDGSLKDKYRWILGETGKDNQFVENNEKTS